MYKPGSNTARTISFTIPFHHIHMYVTVHIYTQLCFYKHIDIKPCMACMPFGIVTRCKNLARCSSLAYHIVTNAHFCVASPQVQCHVEDAFTNKSGTELRSLYLRHFNLFASPRKCITGAVSPSLKFRVSVL